MADHSAETDTLPQWDLSNVYPGLDSEPFEHALADLRAQLDRLDRYLTDNDIERAAAVLPADRLVVVIAGYLERVNPAQRLYLSLRFFAWAFVTTDSYDALAKRRYSELEILGARLEQGGVRFQGWLGRQADELPAAIGAAPVLVEHAFYLRDRTQQSRYLMTDPEESLAAELAPTGQNAWSRLQRTVVSQLSVPFERDGHVETLPMTELLTLAHDPEPEVRRRAYAAEIAAWETVREPLAAAINGVKGATITLARRRGRTDPLHAALDQARVDRGTLDAMLDAMRASFPAFRRYLKKKAERLGQDALPWWDMLAPAPDNERRYSFAEARDLVLEQFFRFSPRLGALAGRAFNERWIDAGPRAGKSGGAFCMPLPAVDESRVLCNFDGSFDEVLSMAHELGHAFHNECQVGKTELQKITPMTLAETASTFCTTITIEGALSMAGSPEERLSVLEGTLINASQIIVDITSRFVFEQEVFERRARSELSADELCDIMLRAQAETYGDGRALPPCIHVDVEAALLLPRHLVLQLPVRVRNAVRARPVRDLPRARRRLHSGIRGAPREHRRGHSGGSGRALWHRPAPARVLAREPEGARATGRPVFGPVKRPIPVRKGQSAAWNGAPIQTGARIS
jgi:pepF/M3 family oligoendopeptidase